MSRDDTGRGDQQGQQWGRRRRCTEHDRLRGKSTQFQLDAARAALDGLPGGRGLNIAHEAIDRHVAAGRGEHTALRLLGKDGARRDVSYDELAKRTNRFANVLGGLGVARGDVVAVLCGRQLDLYVAVLGALKQRCVVSPIFSAFGPEPIRARLELGRVRVLVTTPELYVRKVAVLRADLPLLDRVIVTGGAATCPDGTVAMEELLAAADDHFEIQPTDPEDVTLLHFTSGTTGTPKGAARAWCRGRSRRDEPAGSRPARRRCVLVHRSGTVG